MTHNNPRQDTQERQTRNTRDTKKNAPKKKTQQEWSKKNISLCGHNFPPPSFSASLFFFLLFHNLIFLLPQTGVTCPVIGPSFHSFFAFTSFLLFVFLPLSSFLPGFRIEKSRGRRRNCKVRGRCVLFARTVGGRGTV